MNKQTLIGGGLAAFAVMATTLYLMPESEQPESQREASGIERSGPAFRAGNLDVSVTTDPRTPRVGDNTLIIEKSKTLKLAKSLKVFVYGLEPDGEAQEMASRESG